MTMVNMLQAKTTLSRLVEDIELGREQEIVIARNGRPVARLVPLGAAGAGPRIGVARGKFEVPDSIDGCNAEIARLFKGDALP